jgi:site-specific recombinase XerD
MSAKKNTPVVVSDEHNEIKIYTVKSRKGRLYQLSYYQAGQRLRKTYADIHEAKREARLQLGLMAGERLQSRALSALEMESYALAMRRLPEGVPLHVCVELFGEAHGILRGHSLLDAARYYMRHYDPQRPRKPLVDLSLEFIESRIASGVSHKYVVSVRCTMRILLRAFAGKTIDDIEPAALDRMLEELTHLRKRSRNTYRTILVSFGNFLKARGNLPLDKPTAFERMTVWRNEVNAVSIYSCEEMSRLLYGAHNALVPFLAIAAFAGMRTAEICRLDWSNVHLDRGFIECEAKMAKTRSRRLIPISDNLRAWLEPLAQPCGKVVAYQSEDQAMRRFHRSIRFKWKRNALRHSYISYRLAVIADTARVALECGNSPDVIFKHYRELVTPEEACKWFSIMPGEGYPENTPYYKPGAVGKKRNWRKLIVPRMKHDELAANGNATGIDT